jgi:hypothetical protein
MTFSSFVLGVDVQLSSRWLDLLALCPQVSLISKQAFFGNWPRVYQPDSDLETKNSEKLERLSLLLLLWLLLILLLKTSLGRIFSTSSKATGLERHLEIQKLVSLQSFFD